MSRSFKKFKPKVVALDNQEPRYYFDFPKKPIGGQNPYYMCLYCEVSVPEINGDLYKHRDWCEYRTFKESEK